MACVGKPAVWPLSSPVLADLVEGGSVEAEPVVLDLVDRLAQIDDPRQVSWVEHPLPAVLALCAGAVVAGMSSFTAIGGWVTDVPADLLTRLYARCGQAVAPARAPSKATLWRVVTEVDPAQAEAVIGAWLLDRAHHLDHQEGHPPTADAAAGLDTAGPGAVAVDGKTVRGAKDSEG